MKTFESLFAELSEKAATKQAGSLTVDELKSLRIRGVTAEQIKTVLKTNYIG